MRVTTKHLFLAILCFFVSFSLFAQKKMDAAHSGRYEKQTVFDIIQALEATYQIAICVDPNKLPWYKISFEYSNSTLHETMNAFLPRHGLTYAIFNDSTIGICKKTDFNAKSLRALRQLCTENKLDMPDFMRPFVINQKLGDSTLANETVELELFVFDDDNNEPIFGANVQVLDTKQNVSTNENGKVSFNLPAGHHDILVKYISYRATKVNLSAWKSGSLRIPLKNNPLLLQEIEISGNKAENKVKNTQAAVESLPLQTIKDLPTLLGEADVVRSLSTLAGVSSAGEGSPGFNVRGGNVDQNLALMDQAPLFNTSHVLGFYSVYNPDMVQNVTLYKGYIPSRFGGKVASVLDVKLRDGDFTTVKGSVGLGVVNGKISLEGPIWKNRVSFMGSYRRSYADWLLRALKISAARNSAAWFGDGLVKLSARIGERSTLSLSAFQSKDYFVYRNQFGYNWATRLLNLSFKHPIAPRLLSIWQGNIGQYAGTYFVPQGIEAFDLENGLLYQNLNWRGVYTPNARQEINFGMQWERINGLNEVLRPRASGLAVLPRTVEKDKGETLALFVEDDYKINNLWSISTGLRLPLYRQIGPDERFVYREEKPRTVENIIDTLQYARRANIYSHLSIEPRFSIKYQWNGHQSLKASYGRVHQYVHQISNLTAPTPVDIWQVSNNHIGPQQSDNFNIGYSNDLRENQYAFSSDVFYRITNNVPVFKNLPTLLLNEHIETEVLSGQNNSYGFEASLRRNKGWLTGWFTYTYARSIMLVKSRFAEEQVNRGKAFASDYDQPHQINAMLKFSKIPSFFIAINYIYRTGRPVTGPSGIYQVGNVVVSDFSNRNNFRIPDYHRVDISMNVDQNKSKVGGVRSSFSLSVYNALFRQNPYSVFFQKRPTEPPSAYSLALIGTAIPAASLTITF